jgi:hypothetical protein
MAVQMVATGPFSKGRASYDMDLSHDRPLVPLRVGIGFSPPFVLATQPRQLLALGSRQSAGRTFARIDVGALHPLTQRTFGQIQILGDLADAPIANLAETHRLCLDIRARRGICFRGKV